MPEPVPSEDACPRCAYSLAGLPDEHCCPECGFAYERGRTLVIRQGRRVPILNTFLGGLFLLGAVRVLFLWSGASVYHKLEGGCWLAFGAWILWAGQLGRRNRAVLTPWGFSLISRRELLGQHWWREVSAVAADRYGNVVNVCGRDGNVVCLIPHEFFGSQRALKAFVAAANERLAAVREGTQESAS